MTYPRLEIRAEIEAEWRREFTGRSAPWIAKQLDIEMNAVERDRKVLVPLAEGLGIESRHRGLDFLYGAGCEATALAYYLGTPMVAVDTDSRRHAIAEKWAQAYGVSDKVEVRDVADLLALPFEDATFDFVLSAHDIPCDPDGERGPQVRELVRILKPGGHLIVYNTPNGLIPGDVERAASIFNGLASLLGKRQATLPRGLTFGQILTASPYLQFTRGQTDAIRDFSHELTERLDEWPQAQDITRTAVEGLLKVIDNNTLPTVDWPAEALLPTLNLGFVKDA